jgi:HD-like signal output (HDOD) protein
VAFEYDHAEIGATLMENWGASRALIDGIRLHHQPEAGDSHLASILYLAETRNDDRESMPAPDRVIGALADCGLTGDELTSRQSQRIAI